MKTDITPALLHRTLTKEQLEVWQLASAGFGYRRISRILNISVRSTRDRLDRAYTAIEQATRDE